MSRILNISQGNYRIKVEDGGSITLDTGTTGSVIFTGGVIVQGSTTTLDATNTHIKDNIIVLNDGQTGNGISGYLDYRAGIQLDRGNLPSALMVFDESIPNYDPITNTNVSGGWELTTSDGKLSSLSVQSIVNGSGHDTIVDMQNTNSVLRIANSPSYHLLVTDDNCIPNKKYVDTYITSGLNGLNKSAIGLANVDNTSDANKPVSADQQIALDLKANLASPSFSGTVSGISNAMVGLGNVENTALSTWSGSTNINTVGTITTGTWDGSLGAVSGSNLTSLNGSNISSGTVADSRIATTLTGKTYNGITPTTVANGFTLSGGITSKTLTVNNTVGLSGTDGSTLNIGSGGTLGTGAFAPIENYAPLSSPVLTGIPSAPTAIAGTNTTQLATTAFVSTGLSAKEGTLAAGTIAQYYRGDKSWQTLNSASVGLGNVDNTADANKPVSTAAQAALDLKANLASPTFTGTVSGITATMVGLGNVTNTSDAAKPVSTAQQFALDLKANLASPTFTGTVSGITATMVGLGNVNNTSDTSKPISTAQQTALDLKANLVSPTFTGTVSGITKSMVGLGSVDNTSDVNKPVSTAQQTALNLKADLEGATFTGSVTLPSDPTASFHAATKQYVDNAILGLDPKASTKVATTANIALSGTQTIDGIAVIAGDRVLVKNQTTASTNGIYVVAAGTWARATDFDAWLKIPGGFVFVEQGTVNADTGWLSTADQGGTLNTTAITWSQLSGPGSVTAGAGITLSGGQVSITNTSVSTGSYGSASSVGTFTVNAQGQLTAAGSTAIAIASSAVSGLSASATTDTTNASNITSGTLSDARIASALTGKTYNGISHTANATGFSLAGGSTSKTLTVNNTVVLSGTDGSTLNIGAGGTLGTGAFASIANYAPLASPTFTGTVSGITATMVGLGNVENTALSSWSGSTNITSVGTIATGTWNGSFGSISGANLTNLNASNVTSGTVGTARLGTGTANSTTYLRGDGAWATISTGVTLPVTVSLLKGDNAGGASAAVAGTDYVLPNGSGASLTSLNGSNISSGTVADARIASTLTGKTYNGVTPTASTTGFTLAGGTTSKTLTVSNSVELRGADGYFLNIGTGGTLGTGAFATIANYAPLASPTFTGTVSGITATMVGLGNVNNTADTAKPVSTAQQTALDLKANLSGAAFTGVVTLSADPSVALQAATKQYVDNSITSANAVTTADIFAISVALS